MQGVIKSYDPQSRTGVVVDDVDRSEYALARGTLEGSVRMVRQGEGHFDLDEQDSTQLRLGRKLTLVHLIGSQPRGATRDQMLGICPS